MKNKRNKIGIDASSMADIAFLLLTFFMMVTTINQDKGLLMKLPENIPGKDTPVNKRNILEIIINDEGKVLVNNEEMNIKALSEKVKAHIQNYDKDYNLAINPQKAIVFLKQSRGAKYKDYIEVHNILKSTYNEVRNKIALNISNNQHTYDTAKKNAEINDYFKQLKKNVQDSIPYLVQEDLPFAEY